MNRYIFGLAAIAFLPLSSVLAQTAPAASATEVVAPPTCKKPILPSKLRRADDPGEFNDKADAYQNCIKEYADQQQALSKAHVDAANAAINDANAFGKAANEAQQQNQNQ